MVKNVAVLLASVGLSLTAFCPSALAAVHTPGMSDHRQGVSLAERLYQVTAPCCTMERAPVDHGTRPSLHNRSRSDIHATPLVTIVDRVAFSSDLKRKLRETNRIRAPDPKFETRSNAKRE